jgi:hypothetical protein
MLVVAVLISVVSIVLFIVGAVIILVSIKDGQSLNHPVATPAITVVGLLGTAYGLSISAAESFSFTFGNYLQMLGCSAALFIICILLSVGIMFLVEHLG